MSAPRLPATPRAPRPPSLQRVPTGAPRPPRARQVTQENLRPYPEDLSAYPGTSDLEHIVSWWLIAKRGYVQNRDFVFQVAIGTEGAIGGATNTKGFLRCDFLLLPEGKHGGLGYPYQRGLILNPYPQMGSGSFQIHTIQKDRLEREVLAQLGFRVVYLESTDLYERTDYVLREALRGVDISSHAR